MIEDGYLVKKEKLLTLINQYVCEDIMVAFSGGVDSAFVLKMACNEAEKTGKQVYAVTIHTRLHPVKELEETKELCGEIGARHIILKVDELKEAGIMDNPVNRCYLCKKLIFLKIKEKAAELGIRTILEGTNEDDLHVYRPGIKALHELGIISPLADAGLCKKEVRALAAAYGLKTSSKPSAPCLATRFPYGTTLDYEKLAQVEQGEAYLKNLGLHNVRLRVHDDIARIEVDEDAFGVLTSHGKEIAVHLKELGYVYITLDLEGFRSGSMDVKLAL
ncbi:ATP-dependent sacrificial sulfur transferase LarE [bacterium 1xD42-62]|uniref:ATP-dependent sacrificial sulfur transferase LarE n=2 Tax=Parablautia muri TaxID=2320879 RepID=A0A9X5GTK2_9FIRM|nr:ATP-dependent sacrificial sulfur transferase LarE [Parablautia muri]NBJ94091.1 ATP-dependent sacrificial sulfur transferase LarE [Parablautia muri]